MTDFIIASKTISFRISEISYIIVRPLNHYFGDNPLDTTIKEVFVNSGISHDFQTRRNIDIKSLTMAFIHVSERSDQLAEIEEVFEIAERLKKEAYAKFLEDRDRRK